MIVEAVGPGSRAMRIERIGEGVFVLVSVGAEPIPEGTVAVRVTASLRAESIQSRISGFFVTLRGENGRVVATDNMNGRPFTGTQPWTSVETMLPVLPGATHLEFGPTLAGRSGVLWADDFRVEMLTRDDVGFPSDEATSYVLAALDTLRVHALRSDSVDWVAASSRLLAGILGAQTASDTYEALKDVGRFADRHTTFLTPERLARMRAEPTEEMTAVPLTLATGQLLSANVGYVNIPGVHVLDEERLRVFADSLIHLVADFEDAGACRWIVDLRRNSGGHMFPMLAGLEPLLGTGDLGYFVDNDDVAKPWYIVPIGEEASPRGTAVAGIASVAHSLRDPDAPVVVLIGPGTTSSGEVVALSFRGRPATTLIGTPSGGFTTGNAVPELSDGAVFNITSSVYADRTGRRYGGPITPDMVVEEGGTPGTAIRIDGDAAIEEASRWFDARPACPN